MDIWDEEVDLLVIGGGAGGLTAALVGALEGLTVVLCEKSEKIGGTTAISGGGIWIAGSTQANRAGYVDTITKGREYLHNELGTHARDCLIEAYTTTGPELLDYLEQRTKVLFDVVALPDYHAETPGGVLAGRVLLPKPFDGRTLGDDFQLIAPPLKQLMILGGMMVAAAEIPMMIRPFQSWKTLTHVVAILARYTADRIRYPRGTRLLNGNALVARLFSSLRETSADIRPNACLVDLIGSSGRVEGALIKSKNTNRRIKAKRGVILATGGVAQDSDLRQDLMKNFPHLHTIATRESTGDGVRLALRAGAAIDRTVSSPAVWTPASVIVERDGTTSGFPYGYLDRGKPGAIAVDSFGKRFVNEANSYHDVVIAMFKNTPPGVIPRAHLVCDSDFIEKYGIGVIRPHDLRLRSFVKKGYLIRAKTLGQLALKIGASEAQLTATVATHNDYACTGVDKDFNKGATAFNRANGDPLVKPNCNLKAIIRPPFYALPITPATLATSIGLETNRDSQVMRTDGEPIDGLYACGNDVTSVMRGYCPGAGVTLGPAMVFAFRAVMHARKAISPVATSSQGATSPPDCVLEAN